VNGGQAGGTRRPAQRGRGGQRGSRADDVAHAGRPHRGTEPAQPQPAVRDHRDRAKPPTGIDDGDEVDARWHEHGDTIARLHATVVETLRERGHSPSELGTVDGLVGSGVADRNGGRPHGGARLVDQAPQRHGSIDFGGDRRRHSGTSGDGRFHERGQRHFQHCEVSGAADAMQFHIGEASAQVLGKVVVEHWVACAPHQPHGDGQRRQLVGHRGDVRSGRMARLERHVGHEVGNAVTKTGSAVGRGECPTLGSSEVPTRQPRCAAHEQRRGAGTEPVQPAGGGQLDQPRRLAPLRHRDARVGQHHARHALGVRDREAHGHRTTPVLRDQPHRPAHIQRIEQVGKVEHTLAIAAASNALRPPHRQLVGRDHPVLRRQLREQTRPQERPGGIAVQTHHCGTLDSAVSRCCRRPVEQVPATSRAVVAGHVDGARPGRHQAPCAEHRGRRGRGVHQTISVALVLRPEPMPRHSTRSPG
jgi:hypothetical protein